MDLAMDEVKAQVEEAVRSKRVTRFEDYEVLLDEYPHHAAMQEGQEAFGVVVCENDEVGSEAGSEESQRDDGGVRFEGGRRPWRC